MKVLDLKLLDLEYSMNEGSGFELFFFIRFEGPISRSCAKVDGVFFRLGYFGGKVFYKILGCKAKKNLFLFSIV